jgi:hypothetical protein
VSVQLKVQLLYPSESVLGTWHGGNQRWSGYCVRGKRSLLLPGIELWLPNPQPVTSQFELLQLMMHMFFNFITFIFPIISTTHSFLCHFIPVPMSFIIYGLFNDAANSSDYMPSNVEIISE